MPSKSFTDKAILYFSVVSVNHIITVCFISSLSACVRARTCLCSLGSLCLLIHLGEEFLCALHQFVFAGLDVSHLSICDLVCICTAV